MFKKFFSLFLTIVLICTSSTVLFAKEVDHSDDNLETMNVSLDSLDLSVPFEIHEDYITENGEVVTIGAKFKPNPEYNPRERSSSSSYTATVGTWTSYFDGFGVDSRYDFDLTRSGSDWKISNARNYQMSALFATISNKQLTINRAVSSASFPAEVAGSATGEIFDTTWAHLGTVDFLLETTVSSSGVLTVTDVY